MGSKYDNMMKCAQVRSLSNEKQYRNAYEVIQTININQITAITDLNTIADVYIQLQKYAEAKNVYLILYNKFPVRRVVYQLVYLSLKCGEIEEAEEFYSEYESMDQSGDKTILRYYIDKAKGTDRQTLIHHLEELKKIDYMEEWAYELAKLYHKEGMVEECVQECSDIILWFGEGLIVEKAMLLKHHYMDGADISSESAIMEETRNMAAELRIAAEIAERNEREQEEKARLEYERALKELEERERTEREQKDREAELLYVKQDNYLEESVEEEMEAVEEEPEYQEEVSEPVYENEVTLEGVTAEELDYMATLQEIYQDETDEDMEEESDDDDDSESDIFKGELAETEAAIVEIVTDIKKSKGAGHIGITGNVLDKNIEIGKCFAKELCRQKVLPTSKIARINAESLEGASLLENREKLEGGCLLIEDASKMTLDCIQNLYQLVRKTRGNMIIILSDSEENLEVLLKKNRKLGKLIEYHVEM